MLLRTHLVLSNYLFKYIYDFKFLCYLELSWFSQTTYSNIYITSNSSFDPVTTHLLPLPLYNPIYPVKAVTYADNYRCVANYT